MRSSCTLLLVFQLALAAQVPAAAAGDEQVAVLADGTRFHGEVDAADAGWQLVLRGGSGQRTVSAAELIRWGACRERSGPAAIVLADGGVVAAETVSVHNGRLNFDSEVFAGPPVPTELCAGIVFHQPAEPQNDDLLADRIVAAAGRWDRLLLLNGDELSGRLVGIAAGLVDFETELGSVKVAADRIRALIFKPATRRHEDKTERLRAWVGLCDGSRLLADRVVIAGKSLTLMASGRTWTTTPQRLVFLQPLGGRAVYLSDVRPADYRQTPFLDLPWPAWPTATSPAECCALRVSSPQGTRRA